MSPRLLRCPINLTLETFGDRWSLVVLRDIMFGGHRTFRSLLAENIEEIATNILTDRLKRLTSKGFSRAAEIRAMMVAMGSWGL